jgi:hypothetical protein
VHAGWADHSWHAIRVKMLRISTGLRRTHLLRTPSAVRAIWSARPCAVAPLRCSFKTDATAFVSKEDEATTSAKRGLATSAVQVATEESETALAVRLRQYCLERGGEVRTGRGERRESGRGGGGQREWQIGVGLGMAR